MPLELPFLIETHDTLPSTQDTLRERLLQGEDVHGLVVRALEQTAGRGQRARDWRSTRGGSYQTLAVHDLTPPVLNQAHAPIVIALGLAETLPEYGLQVRVKWPNDLWYRGKKVAGILCEYLRGHLLVGVGVNVANEIPPGATAFRGLDPEGVSNLVLAGVQRGLELLESDLELPAAFAPFDALRGRTLELEHGGRTLRGVGAGLDARGCLVLECPEYPGGRLELCGEARSALRVL